jgi:hypothetical protein
MAQTGFTPIQLYYSSTTTNVPLAADLANGELAINITDGKLFYKDNGNAVQVIGWKVVPATAGGTGQTSYAVGDLLYANTTTTLAKLPDVATGNALISGGVGVAPSWGKIGLTTHVSGVLPVANGGTNASAASITAFNNITGYTASGATGTTSTNLVFSTSPSITTPTLIGDANLSTGNITQGTASKGINFTANSPAAGMTSQLLNWYEEGTFTPTIGGDSVAGTQTYTVQVGRYTRIGNRVNFNLRIILSAKDAATAGNLIISGLPFASNSTASNFHSFSVGNAGLFTLTAGYTQLEAHIEPNLSYFYLGQLGSGVAYSYLQASALAATSRISVSGQYMI